MKTINEFSKIGIIDFGGQYAHLIASRIRRLGIYTEILSNEESIEKYSEFKGLIFSGGPNSVYSENSPDISEKIFNLNIPILGICYGHQLIMKKLNGEVKSSIKSEFGRSEAKILKNTIYSKDLRESELVWMSHGDEVVSLPEGFIVFAETENCRYAGVINEEKKIIGIQFHPEVTHTENGEKFLQNFVELAGAEKTWNMEEFLNSKIKEIQNEVTDGKSVFLLVSGGVDSTVAYALLSKSLGKDRVMGLLIDTGFMRLKEVNNLKKILKNLGMNLKIVDASGDFYNALKGITDPEKKRKIIGSKFLEVNNKVMGKMIKDPENWILGQGTIYPDTIESGGTKHSHNIKTHHNRVDEILELMKEGKLIEPIRELYKDEVRALGKLLGFQEEIINRHPFPGPGLAVRMLASHEDKDFHKLSELKNVVKRYKNTEVSVLPIKSVGVQGDSRTYKHCAVLNDFTKNWDQYNLLSTDITNNIRDINRVVLLLFQKKEIPSFRFNQIKLNKEFSDLLRKADFIVNKILIKRKIVSEIWQMPIALLPVGDKKNTYSIVLRPVQSQEAMTANFYPMNRKILKEIYKELKKIKKISYIFYDNTNKPPGTIEWE